MDVEQNRRYWETTYDWPLEGDEWSEFWGGTDYEWWGTLFPRVRAFLPTGTVLEIGTGYGRWTRYLVRLCERLIGIDLAENCIERCREHFAEVPHATFHLNDGTSLDIVPDGSIDFAFSFDSLVHAESDVLEAYVTQLAGKLNGEGVGFFHHSNLSECTDPATGDAPDPGLQAGRAASMGASLFRGFCEQAGLACIGQELVNWQTDGLLVDCFSLCTRPESRYARPNRVRENRGFMQEAANLGEVARLYGPASFEG